MKVLLIIQDWNMPSSRVRILNLLPELEAAGLDCEVKVYPHGIADKFRLLFTMPRYDAVLIQKKLPSPLDTFLIRLYSKHLLFDFDDAIYLRHESEGAEKSRGREIKAGRVVAGADLVIAGNRILRDYAAAHNKRVEIIPSAVDIRGLPVKNWTDDTKPVVIGWVGGHVNLRYLYLVEDALKNLSRAYPVELHIVCDCGLELEGVTVRHIPWSLDTQAEVIAGFDIGIMPLPHSRHAEGKCGYKAIQCMAAGVPVVVSDVGVNRDIVSHGEEGFVAADEAAFEAALEKLVASPELRKEMGGRARQKVEREFTVEQAGKRLAELLQSVNA